MRKLVLSILAAYLCVAGFSATSVAADPVPPSDPNVAPDTPVDASTVPSPLPSALGQLPSATAAGCYGMGCNGLNPSTQNCDNVYTATFATKRDTYDGIVELRYSPTCAAYWARYRSSNLPNCGFPVIQIKTGVRRADGSIDVVNGIKRRGGSDCYFFTKMLNGVSRYGRVRVGQVYSGGGHSEDIFGAWSAWKP